jgi:deoxyribodipyrimidine photo-lyase
MIQPERVRRLNDRQGPSRGRYVLYWMQAAQRAEWNPALEFAILQANGLALPVVVLFCLVDDFPGANLRHYHFMLQGLQETRQGLEKRGLQMVVLHGPPGRAVADLAADASLVVVDAGLLRVQRTWRTQVARRLSCPLFEVEANLVVPAWEASDKAEFSAATFRPRIHRRLDDYLRPIRQVRCRKDSLGLRLPGQAIDDLDRVLSGLRIDRSVQPVPGTVGGPSQARIRLREFLVHRLDHFADLRNDPTVDCTSGLSPFLHFGQISPLYVALQVARTDSPGREAFLEELIVRRELAFNFVCYNPRYDQYEGLAPWARRTLGDCAGQHRPALYSLRQFEQAATHDAIWNAAQREMVLTGRMHGYLRMYWGKKILEWSRTPQEGFKIATILNDRYELDGRDPNGYAGVAWCFGQHDRPWPRHPVFGQVRSMTAAGLGRKFDVDAYVEKMQRLSRGS